MAILAVFLFLLWYFYPTICQWRDEMLDMPLSNIQNLLMVQTHRIHVWYIYLHLLSFLAIHVGKYTIVPWILWFRHPARARPSLPSWVVQPLVNKG